MNILPTKYVEQKDTLLYSGAILLKELTKEKTVSELWNDTKEFNSISNFERFIATLDMLYMIGLIELKNNKLVKVIL